MSFIGKDVIAIGHGSAILCIDLNVGTEHTFRVTKPFAEGVSGVCGHAVMPMFAFSEQCNWSKMFVMTYPDFKKVCQLVVPNTSSGGDGDKPSIRRICSMVFSETEHLIVLTGYPNYALEVWNWRTEKLLGVHETGIITDLQILKYFRICPV